MRNVILIISHKRPECSTVKALKKAGYAGDWYIVADDLDDTEYEKIYPDHVVRFSKQEYAKTVDTADNFGKMTTPVYARNACFDIAKDRGYDCFALLDDDLQGFFLRYISGEKLRSKPIRNMTAVFEVYCRYILDSGFASGGFVSAGRLIGGGGKPSRKKEILLQSYKCVYHQYARGAVRIYRNALGGFYILLPEQHDWQDMRGIYASGHDNGIARIHDGGRKQGAVRSGIGIHSRKLRKYGHPVLFPMDGWVQGASVFVECSEDHKRQIPESEVRL